MGNTYEVSIWMRDPDSNEYFYNQVYGGESAIKAIITLLKCKALSKCIKFEWRP